MATDKKTGKKKSKRKRRIGLKIALVILELIILVVALIFLWTTLKMSKMDTGNKEEIQQAEKNELPPQKTEEMEKYTTIAIFGLDNRSSGNFNSGNSDVIMLASINEKTKEIQLVSVYRDTVLDITGGDGLRKANAAFNYGGVEQAVSMLNVNLDLQIDDYVIVDFNAVAEAVDILGGLEIELTGAEVKALNSFVEEVAKVTGKKANFVSSKGLQTLDGVQVTSYCRIRQTSGSDYKRTERQRLVIQKMLEKALKSDLGTINDLIDEVFDDVKTSMTITEIMLRAKDVFSYKMGENTGFPFHQTPADLRKAGDCVVPVELANNVVELHKFLYNDEDYSVSSKVQEISDEIVNLSGLKYKPKE